VLTWNRAETIIRGGTEGQRPRPPAEGVSVDMPAGRIIPEDLWAAGQSHNSLRSKTSPLGTEFEQDDRHPRSVQPALPIVQGAQSGVHWQ
jgi:hypothetical protein